MKTDSKPRWATGLAGLALLAFAASFGLSQLSYSALSYRPDFSFYYQFAARAADPLLEDRQTFNVSGNNMFGIIGREGQDRLHQALHLEPIKYLDVLGLKLGAGVTWMFLWRSLVQALPLLILALAARGSPNARLPFLVGLAYLAYPSFLFHATFDARPYMVMGPALFSLYLAIHQKLNGRVVLGLLTLTLLAREEAVWLAGFAVVFLHLWSPERRRLISAAYGLLLFWLVAILLYMNWTGYEMARSLPKNVIFVGLMIGSVLAVLVLARIQVDLAQAAAILAPLAIVSLKLLQSRWDHDLGWLYFALHPRPFTVVPSVAVLLLWLSRHRQRWAQIGLLAVIGFSICVHLFSSNAPLHRLAELQQRSSDAALVFETRQMSDRYATSVLCDRSTCHAFADFENSFHYSSLFGTMGFPERGPGISQLPSWLQKFDLVVVEQATMADLATHGDFFAHGWTTARQGPWLVLSKIAE